MSVSMDISFFGGLLVRLSYFLSEFPERRVSIINIIYTRTIDLLFLILSVSINNCTGPFYYGSVILCLNICEEELSLFIMFAPGLLSSSLVILSSFYVHCIPRSSPACLSFYDSRNSELKPFFNPYRSTICPCICSSVSAAYLEILDYIQIRI